VCPSAEAEPLFNPIHNHRFLIGTEDRLLADWLNDQPEDFRVGAPSFWRQFRAWIENIPKSEDMEGQKQASVLQVTQNLAQATLAWAALGAALNENGMALTRLWENLRYLAYESRLMREEFKATLARAVQFEFPERSDAFPTGLQAILNYKV
jgi:hypothetical protein